MFALPKGYVIVVKDGKGRLVDVKEGLMAKEFTEVFGSLSATDRIALKASQDIRDGDLIN